MLDNKLKEIREQKKISLNQCIKETGISRRTLKRYEKGEMTAAMNFIIVLADYYDISLDEIFGRETPKRKIEMER